MKMKEAYLGTSVTNTMEVSVKIVNGYFGEKAPSKMFVRVVFVTQNNYFTCLVPSANS